MSLALANVQNLSLSHFSSSPVLTVLSVSQELRDFRSEYEKPRGLWVSVDGKDSWDAWCAANNSSLGAHRHAVMLRERCNVLLLQSRDDLLDFTAKYGRDNHGYEWAEYYIDWPAVAREYAGLIIAPYQWSSRLDLGWYYSWDCASGCIWNADAIKQIAQAREAA